MLFIQSEVKVSPIAQQGLFTTQFIKKGTIVGVFTVGIQIIEEKDYNKAQEKGDDMMIRTGARYVGKYFLHKDKIENEEYLNHSPNPNILYHCGVLFAIRDIQSGEELCANYQYIFAHDDATKFNDTETGNDVNGLPPLAALKQSTGELAKLLYDIDELL